MLTNRLTDDLARFAHSCRKRAEVMHMIANTMDVPQVQRKLREQALEWERMAENAQKRHDGSGTAER
ncbi:MAG: hypothetical protein IT566_06855 [Rhodospirillaceae bacterium]|nr:hypothetical protein [Rhodospirillaceae bacterium]